MDTPERNAGFSTSPQIPPGDPDAIAEAEFRPAAHAGEVLIIGGGAAGLATAASILKRRPETAVTVLEPSERHYYQPGWTMIGGGVFKPEQTFRPMKDVMPRGVRWLQATVAAPG